MCKRLGPVRVMRSKYPLYYYYYYYYEGDDDDDDDDYDYQTIPKSDRLKFQQCSGQLSIRKSPNPSIVLEANLTHVFTNLYTDSITGEKKKKRKKRKKTAHGSAPKCRPAVHTE